jgi:hypothetical protein
LTDLKNQREHIENELRDEFAKAALPGVLEYYDTTDEGLKKAADVAYRLADFMLKRRNRK